MTPEPNVFLGLPIEEGTAADKEHKENDKTIGEEGDKESDPGIELSVTLLKFLNLST